MEDDQGHTTQSTNLSLKFSSWALLERNGVSDVTDDEPHEPDSVEWSKEATNTQIATVLQLRTSKRVRMRIDAMG